MTKEMIKAIRTVHGWKTDLRIKLTTINRDTLYDWIDDNRFGIFGTEFALSKPQPTSPEWDKYERAIWQAVSQVINGNADE